jgi:pyruvate kinase
LFFSLLYYFLKMFTDNKQSHTPIQFPMQWVANMDVDVQPKAARKTSVICTIGPKTNNVEKLTELIDAGMNIVRMNFSHGDYGYHKSVLDNARAAASGKTNKKK